MAQNIFSSYNSPQAFQPSAYFPQPQGNVYMVNNSMEVGNIPVGIGISAVFCLNEAMLYLKSTQNGAPAMVTYKLTPIETSQSPNSKVFEELAALRKTVESLEKKVNGGKLNELL